MTKNIFTYLFLLLALVSCKQSSDQSIEDAVLAEVGETTLTQTDLELAIKKIQSATRAKTNKDLEDKALQSMVMMRALALKELESLNDEEKYLLEKKAQRYKDELLLESYLRKNTQAQAPTEQQVRDYYQANLTLFGAGEIKVYEMLRAKNKKVNQEAVLSLLNRIKLEKNWASSNKEIVNNNLPVEYIKSNTAGPQLPELLQSVIKQLDAGQTSDVIYFDKKPHLIRIASIQQKPAKPLQEVNQQIRKILAAQKMRDFIKTLGETAVNETNVVYKQNN